MHHGDWLMADRGYRTEDYANHSKHSYFHHYPTGLDSERRIEWSFVSI
jgi:hypothetical protein